MGGFFGTVAKESCVTDLFYGTDYNSHLGTKRGGMATYDGATQSFNRSIHNLESTYFRTKSKTSWISSRAIRVSVSSAIRTRSPLS